MWSIMLLAPSGPEALLIATFGLSTLFVGFKLLHPIAQALGRRLGGGSGDSVSAQELEDLRLRVQELEGQQARMLELEERLDFTERLLTRQRERDAGKLSAGTED